MPCGRVRAEHLVDEEETALAQMRHSITRDAGQMSVTRSAAEASRHTCFINAAAFYAMLVTDCQEDASALDALLRAESSLLRRNVMLGSDLDASKLEHQRGCSLCALCIEAHTLIHAVHWYTVISDADVAYLVQSAAWSENQPGGGTRRVCEPLGGTEHSLASYQKHVGHLRCGSPRQRQAAFSTLFGGIPSDLTCALADPATTMAVYTVAYTKGA